MHHYLTQYLENGQQIVESWVQVNFLRWSFCFSRRRIVLKKPLK